jgi:hypothetical protein
MDPTNNRAFFHNPHDPLQRREGQFEDAEELPIGYDPNQTFLSFETLKYSLRNMAEQENELSSQG